MPLPKSDQTTEPLDHIIQKGGYYYRPNRAGYTSEVSAAGRYTKSEAERDARVEPWHMRAVPLAEVDSNLTCTWTFDDPDYNGWSTQCGGEFMIAEGTPTQNDMRFCCYCGKPMVEVKEVEHAE